MDETGNRLAPVEEERAAENTNTEDPNNEDHFESLESLERPPTHENARGATELAQLRRNYSRASTRASAKLAERPATLPGKLIHEVQKFWRRQISITVDHHTCRDHLGMHRTVYMFI